MGENSDTVRAAGSRFEQALKRQALRLSLYEKRSLDGRW
jgi:hypothetical protein